MTPESFDQELRRRLEPAAADVAQIRAAALRTRPRAPVARVVGALAITVALVGGWLAARHLEREPGPVAFAARWVISNDGQVVRLRGDTQTWMVGTSPGEGRNDGSSRLYLSSNRHGR